MDTTNEDLAAHECDHCGAPLPAADATGTRRCSFCKTVTRAPTPTPAAPRVRSTEGIVFQPVAEPLDGRFKPVNRDVDASARRGCGLGSAIVILALVAVIVVPIVVGVQGGFHDLFPGPDLRVVEASPLVLPGEPSAPLAFVTMTSRYDQATSASVVSLVRSDGTSSDPVWTTDLTGQGYGERPILSDGTSAIVAIDANVFAVSLATGAITWQASLTDVVRFNICDGCFELFGTNLVVLTADGNVQGIDTTTGAPTWSRRLDTTTTQGYAVGPHYVVMDGGGEVSQYRLVTLDPATGAELASFVPVCQGPGSSASFADELSTTSALLPSSAPGRLWFMDGSSPTCVQQYDVTTGTLATEVLVDDESGSLASSPTLLETPLGLVISSSGTVGLVDPSGATYRAVLADPETEVVPFGATDAALLVQATNRRGTATTSVRAVDPNTGATFWDAPMGSATPAEVEGQPPGRFGASSTSEDGVFAAHLDGGAVRVITFREFDDNSQQLTLDSFDAVTGTASPSVTHATGSSDIIPDLGPGVWTGSRLLTSAGEDRMFVIDYSTMSVTSVLS